MVAAHKIAVGCLVQYGGDLWVVAESDFVETSLTLVARFDGAHYYLESYQKTIVIDGAERIAPLRNKSIEFAYPRG
jgi:hypothetical protein